MKLPNAHLTVVGAAKITEYLLNSDHPDNGGKAAFFAALGFDREEWETLAEALRKFALTADVSKSMETVHGKKYIVEGDIENPSGKAAWVRTIWIIDARTDFPRFVTAYPFGR